MDPSEGFARPSDDDPTAAFEKDLGQVNRHLAMQTVLLQSLVQAAAAPTACETNAAPPATPGPAVSGAEHGDSSETETLSVEESKADFQDNYCLKGKVMPQDDPAMLQHLRRAAARSYNQSLKVSFVELAHSSGIAWTGVLILTGSQ